MINEKEVGILTRIFRREELFIDTKIGLNKIVREHASLFHDDDLVFIKATIQILDWWLSERSKQVSIEEIQAFNKK